MSATTSGKRMFDTTVQRNCVIVRCTNSHYRADSRERFRDVLVAAANQTPGNVVLDLGGVILLSSNALRAIREAQVSLEGTGRRIVAADGGELVRGVLKFAPFLQHYPSTEEAIAASEQEKEAGP